MPTILKPECTCHGWVAPSCPIHGINAREAAILRRVNDLLEAPATATPESVGNLTAQMAIKLAQCVDELREALKGANADKARFLALLGDLERLRYDPRQYDLGGTPELNARLEAWRNEESAAYKQVSAALNADEGRGSK